MTVRAAIGLGSNVGNRSATLVSAGRTIAEEIGDIVASSSLWETAPVGGPEQGAYLNGVVVVDTDLPPGAVLERLLAIERAHGRERRERWGPRTLDLDLLLYGDHTVAQPRLTVPHPRMTERRFVLAPLLEVWPDAALPDGTPLREFLPAVANQAVSRLDSPQGPAASILVFLGVGIAAAAMWWLMDLFL